MSFSKLRQEFTTGKGRAEHTSTYEELTGCFTAGQHEAVGNGCRLETMAEAVTNPGSSEISSSRTEIQTLCDSALLTHLPELLYDFHHELVHPVSSVQISLLTPDYLLVM